MSHPGSFVDAVLTGDASAVDVDDYVARWHEDPRGLALHEFLGLTEEEYAVWVTRPQLLGAILALRPKPAAAAQDRQIAPVHEWPAGAIARRPVQSSAVRSLGYDLETETLEVEYQTDGVYQYRPVPQAMFEEMTSGASLGEYLNCLIKPAFAFRKLEPGNVAA